MSLLSRLTVTIVLAVSCSAQSVSSSPAAGCRAVKIVLESNAKEYTLPGIEVKVLLRNGTQTVLEESAGHVCFVDRDGHAWFTRLRLQDLLTR